PEFTYVRATIRNGGTGLRACPNQEAQAGTPVPPETWIVAEGLVEQVGKACGVELHVTGKVTGRELEGLVARHPFMDRDSPIILSPHVTLEQGTGLVHTAPGHGAEDYEIGQKYGLPAFAPVDD